MRINLSESEHDPVRSETAEGRVRKDFSLPRNFVGGTRHAQQGSALVTGLVFLVIIIMLGLSASSGSIQQELGVRNIRDQNVAMEAADAALRAGETWLREHTGPKGGPLPIELDPVDGSAVVKMYGFCDADSAKKVGRCADRDATFWKAQGELWYGELTALASGTTSDLKLVSAQPRFIIEFLRPCTTCFGVKTKFYRVTARGVGMNEKTYRIVHNIYRY